jgi:hypothetical protein
MLASRKLDQGRIAALLGAKLFSRPQIPNVNAWQVERLVNSAVLTGVAKGFGAWGL